MVMKKIFKYMMALTAAFAIVACSDKIEPPTEENPGNEQNPGDNTGGGEGGEQDPPVPATPTYYVTVNGTGTGASWADAASLTAALETAESGAIINVAAGTYVPEKSLLPAVEEETTPEDGVTPADAAEETTVPDEVKGFNILKPVTIVGGFPANPTEGAVADPAANETILDGQDKSYHVVFVAVPKSEGEVVLKGITVKGGNANPAEGVSADVKYDMVNDNAEEHAVTISAKQGGGIAAMSSSLKMENVTVKNCQAAVAAAMYALNTDLEMVGCVIEDNTQVTGDNGIGVVCKANTNYELKISLDNCQLNRNESTNKRNNGALVLYVDGGTFKSLDVKNTVFDGNYAKNGTDIYANSVEKVVISGCTFKNMYSDGGSGSVFFESKTSDTNVLMENTVFDSNECGGNGTAVTADTNGGGNFDIDVVNCAFVKNKAGQRGPIFFRSRGKSGCALNAKVVNSTFAGNYNGNCCGSAICLGEDGTPLNVDVISCTIANNETTRENGVERGALGIQAPNGKTTLNVYNSIVSGNVWKTSEKAEADDVFVMSGKTATINYKSSIIGDKYYNAAGAETTVTPAFAYATMLSAAAKVGDTYVCKLVGNASSNPAFGNGATLAELGALATETVTADVLKKDQTGAARTDADKVIGAYVAK